MVTKWVTGSNIWVLILLALVAVDAIVGPGHVPIFTFIVFIALATTVTLRVISGVRGGVARGKKEASK